MRTLLIVITSVLLFTSTANADVQLRGDLIIKESIIGSEIMGEVLNDTEDTITHLSVRVTLKDETGDELANPMVYVMGYSDPDYGTTSLLPAGKYAPFRTYVSSISPDEIASYEITYSYSTTEVVPFNTTDVTLDDNVRTTSFSSGIYFRGEITNNTSSYIYDTRVMFALRDADDVLQGYGFEYVVGGDFLEDGSDYMTTLIQPGESAPFEAIVLCDDPSAVTTYYKIITYEVGEEGQYGYYGNDQVAVTGGITVEDYVGDVSYLGTIANDTDRDIYNVNITFVSRNSEGKIIDLYDDTVDGTSYEIPGGGTTTAHIAPGESAPFRVDTMVTFGDMASYEYVINYEYDPTASAVADATPLPFTLGQNYPNPFNPVTTIGFTIPGDMQVSLRIYNMAGQLVDELVDAHLSAGNHEFNWNASSCPSGVYLYVLSTGGASVQRKMTLVR